MKTLMVAIVIGGAVSGCGWFSEPTGTPEKQETLANGYEVARLFTRDGVTVYRFYDHGEFRYFASSGSVSWTEYRQNGKSRVAYTRETQTVDVDGGQKAGTK